MLQICFQYSWGIRKALVISRLLQHFVQAMDVSRGRLGLQDVFRVFAQDLWLIFRHVSDMFKYLSDNLGTFKIVATYVLGIVALQAKMRNGYTECRGGMNGVWWEETHDKLTIHR